VLTALALPLLRPAVLQVKQEWEVHASLSHPNIIQAYLGMEDSSGVKLFMEYAGDSDAYSYINAKQRLCLREDDARQLVYDVLTALQYMHSQVCAGRGCYTQQHCLV
jgi:serine/threonine protein kinase